MFLRQFHWMLLWVSCLQLRPLSEMAEGNKAVYYEVWSSFDLSKYLVLFIQLNRINSVVMATEDCPSLFFNILPPLIKKSFSESKSPV